MKIKERIVFYWLKIKEYYWALSSRTRKLLVIAGGVLGFLLVLLLVASIVKSSLNQPVVKVVLPTPVITALPTPVELTNPSRYATDSAVLKLEGNLKDNETNLNNVDIKESDLYPPQLDFNINFP
ncbi:MAG: hypothetical protein ABSA43_01100 [Candidatus Microgenomates bacterium]|jgi:hypothetical protein